MTTRMIRKQHQNSRTAVESILRFSDKRLALVQEHRDDVAETATPYTWDRDEIYEEREDRWDRTKPGE